MYVSLDDSQLHRLRSIKTITIVTPHKLPIKANTNPPAKAIVIPVPIRGDVPFPVLPCEPATSVSEGNLPPPAPVPAAGLRTGGG